MWGHLFLSRHLMGQHPCEGGGEGERMCSYLCLGSAPGSMVDWWTQTPGLVCLSHFSSRFPRDRCWAKNAGFVLRCVRTFLAMGERSELLVGRGG